MDMSILGQEPVSRDWQGITNVSDPDHEGETSEEEKCLPSIYNLQTYNSNKVYSNFNQASTGHRRPRTTTSLRYKIENQFTGP